MSERNWCDGFLAGLSPQCQVKLLTLAEFSQYSAGETIFHEGDPSVYFYLLKSGHVALDIEGPSGRTTLMKLEAGDVFSWSAVLQSRFETASARALDDVEAFGIRGEALQVLCCDDPDLGVELYRSLAEVVSTRLTACRLHAINMFAESKTRRKGDLPKVASRRS